MNESRGPMPSRGRAVWLGIAVGFLAQLGLKTLLPMIVLLATRAWSHTMANPSLWMEYPENTRHDVWFAMQAAVFAGSIFAGTVAAMLVSRRSLALPLTLVILSLIATGFEQFPQPLTRSVMFIWTGAPCCGILLGVLLGQWLALRQAKSVHLPRKDQLH